MKLFVLAIFLLTALHSRAIGQTIADDRLQRVVGFLSVADPGGDNQIGVPEERFETFYTARDAEQYDAWMLDKEVLRAPRSTSRLFKYDNPDDYPRRIIEEPGSDRVLTIFSDRGYEESVQAVVAWTRTGKKLKFDAVLDRALVAGIGGSTFEEIHALGKGRHLVIGRTEGGDGGDVWGTLWIALWREPRNLQIISSTDYKGDEKGMSKVDYKFDSKNQVIHFTEQAREAKDDDDVTDWHLRKAWDLNLKAAIE